MGSVTAFGCAFYVLLRASLHAAPHASSSIDSHAVAQLSVGDVIGLLVRGEAEVVGRTDSAFTTRNCQRPTNVPCR